MEQSRKDIAAQKKKSGTHNCTQAITSTYADVTGMSEEDLMNASLAFAAGMGTLESTCGALIGAGIVLGLKNKERGKTMAQMRAIMNAFSERNGTVTCKVLKGMTGCPVRACDDCVRDAAEFLEEQLCGSEE